MDFQVLDDFKDGNGKENESVHIQLKQQLNRYLNANETIEWIAQPKQGLLFRKNDGCLIPFSLAWGGFVFIWELFAIMNQELLFILWGIPFVFLGVYLIFFRFIHDVFIRKKTIYALSNRRFLFKNGDKFQAFFFSELHKIKLLKHKKGLGTILFNDVDNGPTIGFNTSKLCFDYIKDAEAVHAMIQLKLTSKNK